MILIFLSGRGIIEKTGEQMAKFKWPRDELIEVKNGYGYTSETDKETGLHSMNSY